MHTYILLLLSLPKVGVGKEELTRISPSNFLNRLYPMLEPIEPTRGLTINTGPLPTERIGPRPYIPSNAAYPVAYRVHCLFVGLENISESVEHLQSSMKGIKSESKCVPVTDAAFGSSWTK